MTVIETERLELSRFDTSDSSFIIELLNTPLWIRFIGDRKIRTQDDALQYLLNGPMKSYDTFGFGFYGVRLKGEGIPIGMCGLIKRDFLEHPDIGFAFLPDFMGKGYAYEAASATLVYAKNTLGLNHIAAIVNHDNKDSIRLLEKLGLHFDSLITYPGEEEKLLMYLS